MKSFLSDKSVKKPSPKNEEIKKEVFDHFKGKVGFREMPIVEVTIQKTKERILKIIDDMIRTDDNKEFNPYPIQTLMKLKKQIKGEE